MCLSVVTMIVILSFCRTKVHHSLLCPPQPRDVNPQRPGRGRPHPFQLPSPWSSSLGYWRERWCVLLVWISIGIIICGGLCTCSLITTFVKLNHHYLQWLPGYHPHQQVPIVRSLPAKVSWSFTKLPFFQPWSPSKLTHCLWKIVFQLKNCISMMAMAKMTLTSIPFSGLAALTRTQAPVSSLVMFKHLFTLIRAMAGLMMMTWLRKLENGQDGWGDCENRKRW